jgi:hypothetical protein
MFDKIKEGTKCTYTNPITGLKNDCVVAREVNFDANVFPVNILNQNGEIEYKNCWVSKENVSFDEE